VCFLTDDDDFALVLTSILLIGYNYDDVVYTNPSHDGDLAACS
jgi:hypothetical protein